MGMETGEKSVGRRAESRSLKLTLEALFPSESAQTGLPEPRLPEIQGAVDKNRRYVSLLAPRKRRKRKA